MVPNKTEGISPYNLMDLSKRSYDEYKGAIRLIKSKPKKKPEDLIGNLRDFNIFLRIAETTNKEIDKLDESDFYEHYPIQGEVFSENMFQQELSRIFKRYQINQEKRRLKEYNNEKGYEKSDYISEDDFNKKYGDPPWIIINRLFNEANLDYYVNSPEGQSTTAPFKLELINKINNANIDFPELSSGEKVIISMALALYNSDFDYIKFPKVLLMDEPDASLHPSMIKQFLDVIQNLFIRDKGMKVIISTHSPSTVALATEGSIFILSKVGERIKRVNKDEALKILTSGVPSLSIDYENRRQVFVEGRQDVYFYEKVYDKLRDKLIPEISINFISLGNKNRGGCEEVKEIVNHLTDYGTKTIFGIIDWDLKNKSNRFIKVIVENKRYSIENYIFDPILLAAFLFRERIIDRTNIGLEENETHTDLRRFNNEKLQKIANYIIDKIKNKINEKLDETKIKIKYISKKEIELPKWFLIYNGHLLEGILKETFSELKKYKSENELKREIITKVLDDIPEFISIDLVELLQKIQDY